MGVELPGAGVRALAWSVAGGVGERVRERAGLGGTGGAAALDSGGGGLRMTVSRDVWFKRCGGV